MDITESSVDSEESEVPEVTELLEETESVETTESNLKPATETTPEIPREEPAEEVTEEPEEEAFVAYDPNYVVALATEKTKSVWEDSCLGKSGPATGRREHYSGGIC